MVDTTLIILTVTFLIILLAPLLSKKVEENLEIFFLIMGFLVSSLTGVLTLELLIEATEAPIIIHGIPIGIFQVVIIAGLFFEKFKFQFEKFFEKVKSPYLIFSFLVFLLGIMSSVISAIVASVILAEMSKFLGLPKERKSILLVLAALSIGVGASLTPLGEPLSTIAIHKLSGEPYHADFLFLFWLLWDYVLPIVIICSLIAYFLSKNLKWGEREKEAGKNYKMAIIRGIKIYIFVFALILIGESYKPLVEIYFKYLQPEILYILGLSSAALDNATLTAAIISPELNLFQIKSFLISLLISGGLLIPGNVPNIVIAFSHKITFKEWARAAIPIVFPIFIAAFIGLFLFKI